MVRSAYEAAVTLVPVGATVDAVEIVYCLPPVIDPWLAFTEEIGLPVLVYQVTERAIPEA